MNAIHRGRALRHERGPMADGGRPLALGGRRGVHGRNEAGEAHAAEQFGVDLVALVIRLGDGAQPPRMREHEPHPERLQHVLQPGPGRGVSTTASSG